MSVNHLFLKSILDKRMNVFSQINISLVSILYFIIFFCKLFNPIYSKNKELVLCSTEPLFEFVEDCSAEGSITGYQIKSTTKKLNFSLNGPTQITFDECLLSDALKLKRCVRIAPNYLRYFYSHFIVPSIY